MDRIILLGAKGGPAIRKGGPNPTSYVLVVGGHPYVIDCGLGVTRGFVEAGFQLNQLSTVLITHHHSDHNLEFGNLIHTAWTAGLSAPVKAYGPVGLIRMRAAFLDLNCFDIETRIVDEGRPELGALIEVHEYGPGLVFDDGRLRVTAQRNNHPPVVDSFSLRFEFDGADGRARVVVISGDTTYLPAVADFAAGADVLFHEAMYGPGVDALVARVKNGTRLKQHLLDSHTLVEDAGRIAAAAGVKRLVLNHLVPADDPAVRAEHWQAAIAPTWSGPLDVGYDGLVIEL
jgi:ribonuclease BN (tRNA processing enzyme)